MAVSIKHHTLPAGTDSGDGKVSRNAWGEDHDVSGLAAEVTDGTVDVTDVTEIILDYQPAGVSPLVSATGFVGGGATITLYMPGQCKNGNVIFLAVGSVQHNVSSIAQTGVTWTLVDKGDLGSGNQCHAELWKGVVGSGAKNTIVVTMAGNNTCYAIAAEFAYSGTVATHGNGTQASGTDLTIGSGITSTVGNLVVAAISHRGGTAHPSGAYGRPLVGFPCGIFTNQNGAPVNLLWWKSNGATITPMMEDTGDNKCGAWAVVSA